MTTASGSPISTFTFSTFTSQATTLPAGFGPGPNGESIPVEPHSIEEIGLSRSLLESLILKFLLSSGSATGFEISEQIRIPFRCAMELLVEYKAERLITYRGNAPMNDYVCELTDAGIDRARRHSGRCSYFGSAPVPLRQYLPGVQFQSIQHCKPKYADLCRALNDLMLSDMIISQIGQALNSGRALFLYGPPGNGKSSIAQRLIRAADSYIWIPRTITVTDEIIRLYDPSQHQEVPLDESEGLITDCRVDRRWVRIRRPTVIVGGELQLDHLEISFNSTTGINEAPLQLKANGGALVIDDFGRQRVDNIELLNRWIVPLERGHDYLTLPSGRHIQVPFDSLLVVATNLEISSIADEAFLRRIPYKIEITGPNIEQFRDLLRQLATQLGFRYDPRTIDDFIDRHFLRSNREARFCYARDLLLQVKNFCEFHEQPLELTTQALEIAVYNYFVRE